MVDIKCEDCKGEFDKCFECKICEKNFINILMFKIQKQFKWAIHEQQFVEKSYSKVRENYYKRKIV